MLLAKLLKVVFEGIEVLSCNCDIMNLLAREPNILTNVFTVFVNSSTKCRDYTQNSTSLSSFPFLVDVKFTNDIVRHYGSWSY